MRFCQSQRKQDHIRLRIAEPLSCRDGHLSTPKIRVLSLGAGVQSTTLLLKSCYGELPRLDAAIFADTRGEPEHVYDHLARVTAEAARYGIPVYMVSDGDLAATLTNPESRFASIPYFTLSESGKKGMGKRQCTREFKVSPIQRKVRQLLGAQPRGRVRRGLIAEQWIGFSVDEIGRVSYKHRVEHIVQRYPLLDLGFTREDCQTWLAGHGWNSVAKSACSFCPYRSNAEWRQLRDNHPADWQRAIEIDRAIRKGGAGGPPLNGEAFLHASRAPLEIAPIGNDDNKGDLDGCSPYGCRNGLKLAA